MNQAYTRPEIVDYGSISDHTFSRCNPAAPKENPPKDSIDVPHHMDDHLECSALSP